MKRDSQHNDTQHSGSAFMLSIACAVCRNDPFMLSVIMLNAVMLSVIMLNAVMLSVIMLNAVMLSVIMLSVGAPQIFGHKPSRRTHPAASLNTSHTRASHLSAQRGP
jgi:hypothetical protein